MGNWLLVMRYDSVQDIMTISWNRDSTTWSTGSRGAEAYEYDKVKDVQQRVVDLIDAMTVERLF